jgi:pimeloyl-ACP methyl ester carboxylesterase
LLITTAGQDERPADQTEEEHAKEKIMITKNGFTAAEQSVPMQPQAPYFREAGSGTSVVCIHSSASSSGQWRALMERLADRFRVIAVDLYGSGKTAAWPQDQPMHLDDELTLLSSVFRAAGDRFHLIGHSFGGAIALKAALAHRNRVLSLVVYEPVLFSVLIADAPESAAAREITALRDDTIRLVDEGNLNASAQRFVDYWVGDGTWAATPESRRPALAAAMRAVKLQWHALFREPTPLSAFASVSVPTLFLTGSKSKASTLAVARLVTSVLPRVLIEEIEGAGHMGPVTHPDTVNPLIDTFLEATQPSLAGGVPKGAAHLKGNARQRPVEAPILSQGGLAADAIAVDLS